MYQLILGVGNWQSFQAEREEICVQSGTDCTRLLVNGVPIHTQRLKECITDGILHLQYCNYCSGRLTLPENISITNDTACLLQSILVECPFLNKEGR